MEAFPFCGDLQHFCHRGSEQLPHNNNGAIVSTNMWNEKSIKVQNLTTLAGISSVNPGVGHRHIKGLG